MLALFPQEIVLDYTPQKICNIFAPFFSFFCCRKKWQRWPSVAFCHFDPSIHFRGSAYTINGCHDTNSSPRFCFCLVLCLTSSTPNPFWYFYFVTTATLTYLHYLVISTAEDKFFCAIYLQGIVLRVLERLEGFVVRWVKTLWCAI